MSRFFKNVTSLVFVFSLIYYAISLLRCPKKCPRGKLLHGQGQGLVYDQRQKQGWWAIFLGGNFPRTHFYFCLDFFQKRQNNYERRNIFWPSDDIVQKIEKVGCHIVPKPSTKDVYSYTYGMILIVFPQNRSDCLQIIFKVGALKSLTIFTGKHLCWSLFLMKLSA